MATTSPEGKILKLTAQAQTNVVQFVKAALTVHGRQEELQNKMDAIDIAYARYKTEAQSTSTRRADGVDSPGSTPCGNVFAEDDVTPPIVVSQVDSYVGYLADVFLSGTPMFPIVSNPSNKMYAEQLETLLDDHALLGGYARQLLLFLRNGVKYNYCAVEASWEEIEQFSVAADFESGTGQKITRAGKGYTAVKNLNMRNVFRDTTVDPGDTSKDGDYAGYIEQVSRMRLKKELNKLSKKGTVYNADKALNSMGSASGMAGGANSNYYRQDPNISNYVTASARGQSSGNGVDWDAWFDGKASGGTSRNYGTSYQRVVTYARILPTDFGITAPAPNSPQIWKFVLINEILISAERIISAYDYLPILFGQPMEDGMGIQTQSVAEAEIPFQEAATTLFNIRFSSARRAVSDRALYDPEGISSKDVNSSAAAPKIPVRLSSLSKKTIRDLYHPIPFDPRGTEGAIQDAQAIVGFSKELHGLNAPKQGQFQKGNKSVTEWNDTMAGSDNRLRLPALILEHQFFSPFKSILVLNIYQYGENAELVSQKSGSVMKIDLAKLRQQVLSFRVADGYTPKSKLASAEMITQGLQMISTSPILQQVYGPMIPGMFAHLMQLGGVRGLEEYDPNYKGGEGNAPPGQLQAPVAPPQVAAPTPMVP